MTNVSKNMLFAVAVFVSATVLSLGAFATTVHADDYGFGADGGGWSDYSSYDGGFSDYSSYGGDYSDYSNYGDYSDYSSYDSGWNDYSTYAGGSYEEYNPGYYEEYNPGSYEEYNPGSYEEYNPGYYESYTPDYVDQYMTDYASGNSYLTSGGFAGGSFGGGFGGGFSMPGFSSTGGCTTCHSQSYPVPTPCTTCNHPVPVPTPTCTTCGGSSNTNINTNTNTYIDNSINGSFNTNISNSGNTTILAPVVPQQQIVYQQQVAAPFCVITLQNAGAYNAQATLVWSSSNATTGYISSIGTVAPNGTRYVTGYANQTYSLTVTGQGGAYTCTTQPFVPTYIPPAPITPSVSLEQIPYTGLALSPVAQAFYWLSLFAVAAAGAYLLVYYKGGSLALAGAAFTSRRSNHFVVSEQEAEELDAPADVETTEEATAAPAAARSVLPTMVETKTRDIMSVVRNAAGVPQIVISRA